MTPTDTNVLVDLGRNNPVCGDWSASQRRAAAARGPVLINAVVYAELAVAYDTIEALDGFLLRLEAKQHDVPLAALYLAGKAYKQYRVRGGTRTGVLPDFSLAPMPP